MLRKKYPDNGLLKHLLSSLWGTLCEHKYKYMTMTEIIEQNLNISTDLNSKCDNFICGTSYSKKLDDDLFKVVKTKSMYYHDLARIKPFMTSRARYITGRIALLHIDNVVRIQTDGLVFDKLVDEVMTTFKSFGTLAI